MCKRNDKETNEAGDDMDSSEHVDLWLCFWRLCFAGVATAGRANSVMNACSFLAASTGPATTPGSATARGTGVVCCAIKVKGKVLFVVFVLSPLTQEAGKSPRSYSARCHKLHISFD